MSQSNIDTNSHSVFVSKKLVFPKEDSKEYSHVIDTRDHFHILTDIVNILSERLQPEMKALWDEILQRDSSIPCYYRSGLAMLTSDVKQLSRKWKIKKAQNLDPLLHAPKLKNDHAKHCKPLNDNCNYATVQKQNLLFEDIIPKQIQDLFTDNPLEFIKQVASTCSLQMLKNLCKKDMINLISSLELVKPSKFLTKCSNILKCNVLSKRLVKKVYQMLSCYQNNKVNSIYISNFDLPEGLPFGELIAAKFNQGIIDKKQVTPVKFLIDSGSSVILCPYHVFLQWGFTKEQLQKVQNSSVQGSTGEENIIIGKIKIPFFLKTTEGFFKTEEYEVMITKPQGALDFLIIGGKIWKDSNLKLEVSESEMKASCELTNKFGQQQNCQLFLFNTNHPQVQCKNIQKGDVQGILTFQNTFFTTYSLEKQDKNFGPKFPLIDLNHFNQVYLDNKNWPLAAAPQSFTFSVPLIEPASQNYEKIDFVAKSVYFTNPVLINEYCLPSIDASKGPEKVENNSESTASRCQSNPDVFCAMQADESYCKDKQDNINCMTSPETKGYNFSEEMLERISFDTAGERTVGRSENQINFKKDYGNHLDARNQKQLSETLQKHTQLYAKSKYEVGHFIGFNASIDIKEGATAVQRERRISAHHSQGVKETMHELTENGVFGLSDSGQNEFCCNLNIIPKVSGKDEIRSNSKADKHIQKLKGEGNGASQTTSFRATFDLKTLNEVATNTGRLQLPTIDETRTFVRDKMVSTIDLVNQFWSIKLENGSRKYTNFFYNGKIYYHKRLPMGFVNSPYIAQKAMEWTFADEVFQRFLKKRGLTEDDIPYKSFRDFCLVYLDDVIIASATSSENLSFDKYRLHSICLDAVMWALEEAGWKIGLKKCDFMTQDFVFLGQRFNTKENSTGLDSNRIQAILNWRSPRSIPEIQSRISILSYWSPKIPGLRLIALPLIAVVKSGVFKWTLFEEKAFRNLKFLIALQIKNYNFNPDYKLILTNDASKVAVASALFQLNPNNGMLELLDTQTKLLSEAQRSYSPVQRENFALFFGLSKAETYIRNSNAETLVLSDASSIQFLMRTKQYNSRSYEQSLLLSSLPNVSLYYTSGKTLLISDALSRQYQNIFLKDEGSISSLQSTFIPPLANHRIPEMTKLSNEKLVDFILSNPDSEPLLDVYDRKKIYHQNVHESHITSYQLNVSNEMQLLAALKLGFGCPETCNLPVFNDILKSHKNLSKTAQDFIIKNHNLQKLKSKIEKLNINPDLFKQYLQKYRNPALNKSISRNDDPKSSDYPKSDSKNFNESPRPTSEKYALASFTSKNDCKCQHCQSLIDKITISDKLVQLMCQNDIVSDFISSAISLLPYLKSASINSLLSSREETNCQTAKLKYDAILMEQIFSSLEKFQFNVTPESKVSSSVAKEFGAAQIIPFALEARDFYCTLENNCIIVKTSQNITLKPLCLFYINANLKMFFNGDYDIVENQNIVFLPKSEHFGPFLTFSGGNILNATESDLKILAHQEIFRIKMGQNADNIVLVKVDPESITNRYQLANEINIVSSQENLVSLFSKIASRHMSKIHCNDTKTLSKTMYSLFASADIPNKAFQAVANSKSKSFIFEQKRLLNNLLLGASLAKSCGILNHQLIADDQKFEYQDLFNKLQAKDSPEHAHFMIKKGCLYKKSLIFGQTHLRLVLSDNLTRDLILRLHNQKNFHLSNSKIIAIFNQTFYNKNISKLVKSAQHRCLVCTFFKRVHKRKISGEKRSFTDYKPGQVLNCDVAYMNPSAAGNKFLLLFVDTASSYVSAMPMKSLNSKNTADKLKQLLCHLPAPQVITCDAGHEFGGEFQEVAAQHGILIRTAIPKRSCSNGSVEKCIRDYRDLLLRIISTKGRDQWCKFVPVATQIFNCVSPYNLPFSRAVLFLGPNFFSSFFALVSQNIDGDLFQVQSNALSFVSEKRKKALQDLHEKIGNIKKDIRKGTIVTEDMGKNDFDTVDGSRCLLPTGKSIFKILRILPNGMTAEIKNLESGMVYNRSIEHLRRIDVTDIADVILNLNTEKMFHEISEARENILNVRREELKDEDFELPEYEQDLRRTRAGTVFYVRHCNNANSVPSILKKSMTSVPLRSKLESLNNESYEAVRRALLNRRELVKLSTQEEAILQYRVTNSLKKYHIPNKVNNKCTTKNSVSFDKNIIMKSDTKKNCSFLSFLLGYCEANF